MCQVSRVGIGEYPGLTNVDFKFKLSIIVCISTICSNYDNWRTEMDRNLISQGKDYTSMLPIFSELISESGIKEQDNLIFAGCAGPCYAMATYFCVGLMGKNLNLYYAVDADINQLWKLEHGEGPGVGATTKVPPVKAKAIVLMSGLCRVSFEQTLKFIDDALMDSGIIIGETVLPGLFEAQGWDKHIPFNFLFEFSMKDPKSFKVKTTL